MMIMKMTGRIVENRLNSMYRYNYADDDNENDRENSGEQT